MIYRENVKFSTLNSEELFRVKSLVNDNNEIKMFRMPERLSMRYNRCALEEIPRKDCLSFEYQ